MLCSWVEPREGRGRAGGRLGHGGRDRKGHRAVDMRVDSNHTLLVQRCSSFSAVVLAREGGLWLAVWDAASRWLHGLGLIFGRASHGAHAPVCVLYEMPGDSLKESDV